MSQQTQNLIAVNTVFKLQAQLRSITLCLNTQDLTESQRLELILKKQEILRFLSL